MVRCFQRTTTVDHKSFSCSSFVLWRWNGRQAVDDSRPLPTRKSSGDQVGLTPSSPQIWSMIGQWTSSRHHFQLLCSDLPPPTTTIRRTSSSLLVRPPQVSWTTITIVAAVFHTFQLSVVLRPASPQLKILILRQNAFLSVCARSSEYLILTKWRIYKARLMVPWY